MLPDAWISKIFAKLEGRYGSLFLDRWRGCDMANVKATWAEELSGFYDKPECIGYALKSLADATYPPTLPEFLTACRQAPLRNGAPMLERKPSAEDIERAKALSAKAAEAVRPDDRDHMAWIRRPRSAVAFAVARSAASADPRIRALLDKLLADGVCNDSGRLLHCWDGKAWLKV